MAESIHVDSSFFVYTMNRTKNEVRLNINEQYYKQAANNINSIIESWTIINQQRIPFRIKNVNKLVFKLLANLFEILFVVIKKAKKIFFIFSFYYLLDTLSSVKKVSFFFYQWLTFFE